MALLRRERRGRDFTAKELLGRTIRIEGPVPKKHESPIGYHLLVIADDEEVNNCCKIVLTLEPSSIVEATLTLVSGKGIPEEVTLRENVEVSFSAIVSEVH